MQAAYISSQKTAFFIHVPSDFRTFVKRGKKRFRSVFQQLPSAFFVEEGGDSFSDTVAYEEPFVFQTVRKAAGFFVIFADDVTDTLRTHIGCAGIELPGRGRLFFVGKQLFFKRFKFR